MYIICTVCIYIEREYICYAIMIYLDEFGALSGATANISFVFDKV